MRKAALVLLVLLACTAQPTVIFDNGVQFSVEFAKTQEERAQGLMNRASLQETQGMLFVFDEMKQRTFWMKDTLIALDMIFLDENMTVVHVATAVPCTGEPCEMYHSPPAQYVLEVNAHQAQKNGIGVGSRMSLRE